MRYRETLPSRVSNNLRNYRTNQTFWSLLWYLLQSQANKGQHGEQNVQDRQKIKVNNYLVNAFLGYTSPELFVFH